MRRRASPRSISSPGDRRRSRRRSRWRGNISSSARSRSVVISLPADKAITATRSARSPSAGTAGGAARAAPPGGARRGGGEPFAPILIPSHHIDPCYEYRYRRDGETAQAYGERAADELEARLLGLGPESV